MSVVVDLYKSGLHSFILKHPSQEFDIQVSVTGELGYSVLRRFIECPLQETYIKVFFMGDLY